MKRKTTWLVVSFLTVSSLLVASCAPAVPVTQTTTAPTTTAPTTFAPATALPTTTSPTQENPKYGGIITYARRTDTGGFDQTYTGTGWENPQFVVNDHLLIGDWTRSLAGTGEFDFAQGLGWAASGSMEHTGSVAESWQIPDNQTITFKIRQGVYFHNKPPVNGRELDANDVAFAIQYMYLNPKNPLAYNVITAPVGQKLLSADTTDKWTVVVKTTGVAGAFFEDIAVKGVHLVSREAVEKYGDLKDWRNAVGTGAFMLTDYVPGSSFTFVRNPNYWMKNPIGQGKGDQLPYVDGMRWLIIRDLATELAAFRTGKIETMETEAYDDWANMMVTNPETKWARVNGATMIAVSAVFSSMDPMAVPFHNQRVRWALSMALDREAMIRDYYKGESVKFSLMIPSNSTYYTTFDQKVEMLQKVFGMKPEEAAWAKKAWEYHPDEAKKILAEEGYPNGFKTKTVIQPKDVDLLSIYASYWEKVGVQLEFDVRDSVTYNNIRDTKSYPALVTYSFPVIVTNPAKWVILGIPDDPQTPAKAWPPANAWNYWDPVILDYQKRSDAVYGQYETQYELFQELEAYLAWAMPAIAAPTPNTFRLWQPWLKDFYGQLVVAFRGHYAGFYFAWIDQDMKKAMGH